MDYLSRVWRTSHTRICVSGKRNWVENWDKKTSRGYNWLVKMGREYKFVDDIQRKRIWSLEKIKKSAKLIRQIKIENDPK